MRVVFCIVALVAVASASSSSTFPDNPCDAGVEGITLSLNQVYAGNTANSYEILPSDLSDCGSSTAVQGDWYVFVGEGRRVTASTFIPGSSSATTYDTYIKVYDCYDSDSCVGYNDDACSSLDAQLSWEAKNGRAYFIFVTGYNGGSGDYSITVHNGDVSCSETTGSYDTGSMMTSTPSTASSYYSFANPCTAYYSSEVGTELVISQAINGNTYTHTTLPSDFPACGWTSVTTGRWFYLTGTGGVVTVTTQNSGFDTYLKVYDCFGASSNPDACVTYDDDCGGSLSASVNFFAQSGTTYHIFLGGYFNQQGTYTIEALNGNHGCGSSSSSSSS